MLLVYVRPNEVRGDEMRFLKRHCVISTILAITSCTGCDKHAEASKVDSQHAEPEMIEIDAFHHGYFAEKSSWHLVVSSNSDATLRLKPNVGRETATNYDVPPLRLAEVAAVAKKNGFFALPDDLGTLMPDCEHRRLTIAIDGQKKTIEIFHVDSNAVLSPGKAEALTRALVVWRVVRNLFEEPAAFDSRRSDEVILDRYRR